MRQKIRYDLLANSQKYAKSLGNPIQISLYQNAYKYIAQMKSQVVKPFTDICIHGNFPELLIPYLRQNNNVINNISVHSHIKGDGLGRNNIKILDNQVPFNTLKQDQQFDLIISCLQGHHYDATALFENYISKLKPDGAIIGCCWAENTLKQLRWSYMMAENQRSGGISPKVFGFPTIGNLGHSMTVAHLKMPTIVVRDFQIQVQSVVDILTLLQIMGQSGSLHGKRKGAYRDVILAASAYYDAEFANFQQEKKSVIFSLQMGLFIGWKQHESQPKPLSRRQVINNSFFSELMKNDEQAKIFTITQGNQTPQQIKIQDIQSNKVSIWETQEDKNKQNK